MRGPAGTGVVRGTAAHARRGPMDGVRVLAQRRHRRAPRRRRSVFAFDDPGDRGARARHHAHDRRRCVRAADHRRAEGGHLRPVRVGAAVDRRRDDEPGAESGVPRSSAAPHDRRRLRRVRDGRHGLRRVAQERAYAAVLRVERRRGAVGGPHAIPRGR